MGLTPKEMAESMLAGKTLIDESKSIKAFMENDEFYVITMSGLNRSIFTHWKLQYWQIYEEQKPVFPFKCFDRVLVKDEGANWKCGLFSHIQKNRHAFVCVGNIYEYIAPYEGNEDFATNPDGVKGIWTREML
jgi:hypothetical protein